MTTAQILKRVRKPAANRRKSVDFKLAWSGIMAGHYRYMMPAGYVPIPEFKGIEGRDFRFDYAWPPFKVALEIDGGIWLRKGGHTTGAGKARDCEKDWLAAQHGWRVIRWTPEMVGVANCEKLLELLKREVQ